MEPVNLKERPDLVAQYVALRNGAAAWLLTEPVAVDETREWLHRDDVEVHGLVKGRRLRGVVVLYLARGGEVALFAARQGGGIGGDLLRLIERVARRRGVSTLWAWVLETNQPARRVFEKQAYRRTGREDRLFREKWYRGVRFEKPLSGAPGRDETPRPGESAEAL